MEGNLADLLTEDELLAALTDAHEGLRSAHAEWMRQIDMRRRITAVLLGRKITYAKIAAHLGVSEGAISQYMKSTPYMKSAREKKNG